MVAQNGDPVGDVTVELRQGWDAPSGPLVTTVVTTYTGEYTFTDLAPGDYTVVASRSGYFTRRISVTVGDSFVAVQDIDLNDLGEQGVAGYVFDGPDGIAVDGATVTLHEGYRDPDGPVVATTTIGYGVWQFEHVTADQYANGMSYYTVVATKDGYVRGIEEVVVYEGQWTTDVELSLGRHRRRLARQGRQRRRLASLAGRRGENADATYELWFKPDLHRPGEHRRASPSGTGTTPARVWELAPDDAPRLHGGEHRRVRRQPVARRRRRATGPGTQITSAAQLQAGQWYHIAAQNGVAGHAAVRRRPPRGVRPVRGRARGRLHGRAADRRPLLPRRHGLWAGDAHGARPVQVAARLERPAPLPGLHAARDAGLGRLDRVLDPLLGGTNGWTSGFTWGP